MGNVEDNERHPGSPRGEGGVLQASRGSASHNLSEIFCGPLAFTMGPLPEGKT